MQKTIVALLVCVHAVGAFGAEVDRLILKTDRLTLAFDRARKGAVVSLVDNATGTEFVNEHVARDLFVIAWTGCGDTSGKLQRLASHDAEQVEWDVSDRGLRAVFKRLGGHDMTVTCTASTTPGRDDVRWQLRVTGEAPIVLEEIGFPILDLRTPLTDGGKSDAVVAGLTKGGVYHEPAKWPHGQGLLLSQPGPLAAQFGCYYSRRAGLLSHTRDACGFPKALDCQRTKDGLRWMWRQRCYHSLDKPFELGYEISTTTFTARTPGEPVDWRDAADIYKQWALEQPWCAVPYAQRPDVPEWMKAGPSMIRFHRAWLGEPERVESWLRDYWQKHFPNVPLIVALWGWERVESWVSPKYFPPYPSEEGFLRTVAAAERVGGHAFPWPSGYYWNVEYQENADGTFQWQDWDDFNATGLPHASIFGYLYHEFLPTFQSNPRQGDRRMLAYCAVTGQIPHWVPHWPVTPAPALDNGGFEQWNEDVPAGWQRGKGWQGTDYLGRSFRDDTIKARGSASMRLENRLETDIVQVSRNVTVGPGHGQLQTGHTYRLRLRAKVEHLAKANAVNLAALTPKLEQGLPPEHDFVKQWVELFHGEGRPYLMLGKMIRPPKLIAPAPPVEQRSPFAPIMLNAFRALDGSEAAIIVNATGEEQTVRFEWQQKTRTLQLAPWAMRLVR